VFGDRPLTYKEVVSGLKLLGFTLRPGKSGTSHEQWIKDVVENGQPRRYKVTVDKHHAPFHRALLKSMINQSGVSKDDFYRACLA
jgi:hypothetical protein